MKLTFLLILSVCATLLVQAQNIVSKTLNISAGNLSVSLSETEKNTIAYLTLTGTIDARDFKTMRDDMPVLTEVDLIGANIVAYSGTLGTESGAPNDYLVKEIPKYAFFNPASNVSKTSLTIIKFQPNLLSVSYGAFMGCTGLTSIEIPASVSEIRNGAFENCTNLTSIKCAAIVPPGIDGNIFSGVSKTNCIIYVPNGKVDLYKAAGQWQDFENIIEMIAYWTFDDQTGTLLRDHSGNGLYGKLGGSTWLIDNRLTCLSFNGISDCVLVPPSPSFNFGEEDFAIEIHFKTSVVPSGSFSSLISKHNESINYDKDIEIYIQGGTGIPVFRLSDGTGNFDTATGITNVCDGQFHKVMGVRKDNQLKIYIDGELENSVSTTINPDNENWYMIGKTSYGTYPGSGFFAGVIDEISIWKNPVIKQDTILALNVTAGGLAGLLPKSVRDTLTYLALTGTIDARDFKTMRDSLPLLAKIDLSGVAVAAYIGTEGTAGTSSIIYSENSIPPYAFCYNYGLGKTSLTSFIFPTSATSIASRAFYHCSSLTSVMIPPSITVIEDNVFAGSAVLVSVAIENPNYSSIEGVLFNKVQSLLLHFPTVKTGTYTIPSSVTSIDNGAFEHCSNLSVVNIPSSVTTISSGAFFWCTGLINVTIPSSVTNIRELAFYSCNSLTSIYCEGATPVNISSFADVFTNVNKNTCTLYIPYGSKSAYQSANQWQDFENIVEMTGFKLSETTATLADSANSNGSMEISSNVPWTATSNQSWLTVDPTTGKGNMLTFAYTAEANPSSTPRIATITVSADGVESQTITVTQAGSNAPLAVTAGNLKNLFTAEQLATITKLTLTGTIDARDFRIMRDSMPLLAEVDLSGVTIAAYNGTLGTSIWGNNNYDANTIPECAFLNSNWEGKTGLTSIVFPTYLVAIGNYSLGNCSGLQNVNIPTSVTYLGAYSFQNCTSLTSVFIPASVTSINNNPFLNSNCTFTVDSNNPNFSSSDGVLYNKNQTMLLQCPITKTGDFNIEQTVTSIGTQSFWNCSGLISVNIPSSVTSIGWGAFTLCTGLTSVTIPNSVSYISGYVFQNCYNINSIKVSRFTPLDLSSSEYVFNDINKSTCILYVPAGSKTSYQAANKWQDFQNIVEVGQITTFDDVNIIRNGNFDNLEADGKAVSWGGWTDTSPAHQVVNSISVHSPVESVNLWNYQFSQNALTALPGIPYILKFKAWAGAERIFNVDFEDIAANSYNRYGSSSDYRANGGRSDWTFNITTEPTWYSLDVTFDQILSSTDQKISFMLGTSSVTVYIDSVSLVSISDLALLPPTHPLINTQLITDIGFESAISGGKILYNGGYSVSERGICWSILPNPTVADSKTSEGAGTGNFSSYMSGLSSGTTYYVRAYATNAKGTTYGNTIIFKTLSYCSNIGMVGSFNQWGTNNSDVLLIQDQNDPCSWDINYSFIDNAELKFRRNFDWSVNWGNTGFPGGVAVQGGPNIPITAGAYHLNFNSSTGEYNFEILSIKCNEQDSLALVAIYNATNGPNWSRKDNWLTGRVQTWYGVTVNLEGRVNGLNLARNGLNGSIPSDIGNLTELQKLKLGNSKFVTQYNGWNYLNQNPLPLTMSNLTKLEVLSLDQLWMYSELPDIFGGMAQLRELYIQYNEFTNQSFPGSIISCTNLEKMEISYNGFYNFPDLSGLQKLSNFNVQYCHFDFADIEPILGITGLYYESQRLFPGIPETLNPVTGETISRTIETGGANNIYQWLKDGQELAGQNTKTLTLQDVNIADAGIYTLRITNGQATQLTLSSHPIIIYQSQLPVYKALESFYNSTGGNNWNRKTNWLSDQPITTWEGINVDPGSGLYYLSLFDNNLVGNLPQEIGDLSIFYLIEIANNRGLTGEIPASIGQLTNLQYLYLHTNNLAGSVPSEIVNCDKLYNFSFENNHIINIPDFSVMNNINTIQAQNNKLEFDDIIPNIGKIQTFYYSPQDSIGESLAFNKQVGESFSYSLITLGVQNQYQWYKNGVLLNGKTNSTLEISAVTISDIGKYYCLVTNPQAPNLTLVSRKLTLNVEAVVNLKMLALTTLAPLPNNRAFCGLSNNETITVRLTNTGKNPVSNFNIGFSVDGNIISEVNYSGTINPEDSVYYTFATGANLTASEYFKSFSIKCYLVYNDDNPADNFITQTRKVFGDYVDLPNWTTYKSCDGILSDISWALAEDKNGNIWSTDFYGVSKFDGTNWSTYTKADGLGDNYNWAMINDKDGNIWFSSVNDLVITKYDGVSFTQFPQPGNFDECIYQDSKGNLWFGSYSGAGVAMYNGSTWTYYSTTTGNFGNNVVSIGEDKNGNMYFATNNKIVVFNGNTWNTLVYPGNNAYVSEIFFDSKGNTWFASGSNVFKYNGKDWTQFTADNGTIGWCDDITEDIEGNIWFGGGREIVKYDGIAWTKYTKEDGLAAANKDIYSLIANKTGNIWTGSYGAGISKFEIPQSNCPRHFHTVWDGTSGVDHMNINVIDAKYDGLNLEAGDEIGIFDGNLCVGIGKLSKTINSQNVLSIKVSRNDGTGNGYTSGHDLNYVIWDCSAGSEYEVAGIQCFDNQFNPINCQPFEAGATAFVKLSGISQICQTVKFNTGWSLFSVPASPVQSEMGVLFQPSISNKSLVKIQDELGNSLENWGIFGGWQDNIGSIAPTEGYKIKVSKTDSVTICGTPVDFPYPIPLNTGWNMMGYPQTNSFEGISVLQQLIDRGTLIKVQDEAGNSVENWGIFGGWQNNIGDFITGEGYKIKVKTRDTLWIYNSYPKSSVILPRLVATTHFVPEFEGNGVDHMNINLIGLPVNVIMAGDELAIYDGTTCVGTVTLMPHHLKNQAVSIAASASDNQGMAGFGEGNQFTLKLWKSRSNQEFTLEPEIVNGTSTFTKHETTVASLEKYATTGLDGLPGSNNSKINCYPNPFSDKITVEMELAADAQVQVEILNQLGQRVKTLTTRQLFPGGVHKLVWNGKNASGQVVATGLYHLQIVIDGNVIHKKIVFSR